MTFQDWLAETRARYQTQPVGPATVESAHELYRGAVRRSLDPLVGRPVWSRGDWDVLVILDACRVDQLRDVRPEYDRLPESIPGVWSNASASIDWINRTFNQHPDQAARAGYVTANPFARHSDESVDSADLTNGQLGHLGLLYQERWQDIGNGIETVPPDPVTDHAIHAWRHRRELGIDRLVVHYMQPHEPFRSRPEWGDGDHQLLKNLVSEDATAGSSVYPLLKHGEISLDEFWHAYQDNLRWVLDDVLGRLVENCDAEIVLSSDHGNGLGEWGCWHHPRGAIMPPVRKVPWARVEGVDEETVAPKVGGEESDEQTVAEKLAALGYK